MFASEIIIVSINLHTHAISQALLYTASLFRHSHSMTAPRSQGLGVPGKMPLIPTALIEAQ